MLGRLVGAQFELEQALTAAADQGASTGDIAARLGAIAELGQTLATAEAADLPALRNAVRAVIASALTAVQSDRLGNIRATAESEARRQTANATVDRLAADYYDRRVLDPYLHFGSAAEEEAFRQREQDRREAIERERSTGTVAGEQRAAAIMEDQIRDAGAHGADRSPQYQTMLNDAVAARATLDHVATPNQSDRHPPLTSPTPPPSDDLEGAMAAFRSAGIQTSDSIHAGHGLADRARAEQASQGRT